MRFKVLRPTWMKKAMDLTGKVLVEVNANGEKRQYKTKRWKNIDVAIKEIDKKLKKNHIKSIEHVNFKSKTSDKVVSGMDIVQDYRDSGSTDTLEQYIKKNYIINKKSKKEIEKLKKNKKDKASKDNKQESSKDNPVKENKQDSNKESTEEENKEEVKEESKEEDKDTQYNQDTQDNKQDNEDKEKLDKNKKRRYTQISPEREKLEKQLDEEFEKYYGEYVGKKLETYYGKILITSKLKTHIKERHLEEIEEGLIPKSFETLVSPDGGFPTMDINRNEAWCIYKEYEDISPVAVFIRNGEIPSTYILKNKKRIEKLIERGKSNERKDISEFMDVD